MKRASIALGLALVLLAIGAGWAVSRRISEGQRRTQLVETLQTLSRLSFAWEDYEVEAGYGLTPPAAPIKAGSGWKIIDPADGNRTLPFSYTVEQIRPLLVPKRQAAALLRPI